MKQKVTKQQKAKIKKLLEEHQMVWLTGKCKCGKNLHKSIEEADQHFFEEVFLAGVEQGWSER